jgi:hypothetical protein
VGLIEIVAGLLLVIGSVLVVRAVMAADRQGAVTGAVSERSETPGPYRKAA